MIALRSYLRSQALLCYACASKLIPLHIARESTDLMNPIEGIHHITLITSDAPRNVDFYARVLGLRLVKKTVNQDDPGVYHLFYADENGSPGADITFFQH